MTFINNITCKNIICKNIFFGTYKLLDYDILHTSLDCAYKVGYRHFDCAELYKNQHMIGEFFKKNNISRDSYWITSKLSFRTIPKGEIEMRKSIEKTLSDLNTNYIDLMLIHAPCKNDIIAWKILTEYKNNNIIKNIGISNYNITNLERFLDNISNKDDIYCNQIEFNPFLNRRELITMCNNYNIIIITYGNIYKSNNVIEDIALGYGKSKEQILLQYARMKNFNIIVTSTNCDYIKIDFDLFFTISENDMNILDNMNEDFSLYKRFL